MQSRWKTMSLLLTVLLMLMVTVLAAIPSRNRNNSPSAMQKQQEDDEGHYPITDYAAPESTDPEKLARRRAKGKRYDNQSSEPIKEAAYPYQRTWLTHWWQGLPAIPVAQSDVILIGEVTDAQAYLSNDKTGIYSEFTIRAVEVLKNDGGTSLYPGSIILAERFGGAVRFPSGAIQRYVTRNQRMPHVGQQYVLFLKRIGEEQDFSLITGYELRGQYVAPLDGASSEGGEKLPFDHYKGTDASSFLKIVRGAIRPTLALWPKPRHMRQDTVLAWVNVLAVQMELQ
jgi:hypothetical protein